MKSRFVVCSLAIAACLRCSPLGAQAARPLDGCGQPDDRQSASPISTDRPDITDSTDIVGRRMLQIESGLSFQVDRTDDVLVREFSAPQALLRTGLSDRLELRLSSEGLLSDSITIGSSRTRTTGRSDVEIGFKWKLLDRPRQCFSLALEPVLSLPAGSDPFTSHGYDPTVKFIVDRTMPAGFTASGNVVVSSITDGDRRFAQVSLSASVAHPAPRGWTGFGEIYRASALERDGRAAWIVDVGGMKTIGNRVQIDVSVGRGLSHAAPDWYVGAGFAVRGNPPR